MGKPRGWNLKAGSKDGDRGRRLGASPGGRAVASMPAPADCEHCQRKGFTTWAQHAGHLGCAATARKLGFANGADLYRYLIARYQDPWPDNRAWSQWLQIEAQERGV